MAGRLTPARDYEAVAAWRAGRDLVADAPHRDDRSCLTELAAHLPDVDVDRARVAGERVAPDPLEELVAREHDAAVVEQLPEEVELLRGELHLDTVDGHFAASGIDDQVAVDDPLALGLAPLRRDAAKDRLHPRDELPGIERLRHVVVGADLEPDDLVDVLVARGQHQDRDVGALAQAPADLDAVDVGQHQVEDDQRRLLRLGCGQCVRAVLGRAHLEARVLEVERHEGSDRLLVLDDEDLGRAAVHGRSGASPEGTDGCPVTPAVTAMTAVPAPKSR